MRRVVENFRDFCIVSGLSFSLLCCLSVYRCGRECFSFLFFAFFLFVQFSAHESVYEGFGVLR